MRRTLAVLLALATIVGLRLGVTLPEERLRLEFVPQGMSAHTFSGERVFIRRDGAVLLTGFLARAPGGSTALMWCPLSDVFLDPEAPAIWNRDGRFITGDAERDLTEVPVGLDESYFVRVRVEEAEPAEGRTPATVPGELVARFDAWRAGQLRLGTDFCRDAVR